MKQEDQTYESMREVVGKGLATDFSESKSYEENAGIISGLRTKGRNINLSKNIIETLVYIVVSFVIIMCFRTFVVQHVKVSGDSMKPTLLDHEHLLVEKLSYRFGKVERYDIIVFRPYKEASSTYFVKRVIGLPNDRIQIKEGVIYINDDPIDENYGGLSYTESGLASEQITLKKDEYFVLGDNRAVSRDSRDESVGTVTKDSIMGKVWYVIYPFENFGKIDHS